MAARGQSPARHAPRDRSGTASNILGSIALIGLHEFVPKRQRPANMLAASRVL
ncbi:hypothetical protein NXT3_CH00547 [Sinorhizobium fredii]|uniref:Uncharacterized protein n=1 Tax=Rhizobium fredii TaxID=380 RepID=A0A2L0H0Z6_RHIFR|nr:hypothetical protein NXT3_CH00547 [Sinorhizobium fredii]